MTTKAYGKTFLTPKNIQISAGVTAIVFISPYVFKKSLSVNNVKKSSKTLFAYTKNLYSSCSNAISYSAKWWFSPSGWVNQYHRDNFVRNAAIYVARGLGGSLVQFQRWESSTLTSICKENLVKPEKVAMHHIFNHIPELFRNDHILETNVCSLSGHLVRTPLRDEKGNLYEESEITNNQKTSKKIQRTNFDFDYELSDTIELRLLVLEAWEMRKKNDFNEGKDNE